MRGDASAAPIAYMQSVEGTHPEGMQAAIPINIEQQAPLPHCEEALHPSWAQKS